MASGETKVFRDRDTYLPFITIFDQSQEYFYPLQYSIQQRFVMFLFEFMNI